MINLKKVIEKKMIGQFFIHLLLLSVFICCLITPAEAQVVGTGTCYTTCCQSSVCESGSFFCTESFATQSACQARLAQGTAVCQDYGFPSYCTITAFSGSCSGGGGSSSGGGSFQNPALNEALSEFAGNTPTAGTGGLSQGFGTNNKVAQEQGEASFTKHANSNNEAWLREAAARIGVHNNSGLPANNQAGDSRALTGAERAANFFTAWITPSKTTVSPLTGDSVPRESADYQANYIGGVVIPTIDQNNPPVNQINGGGKPITGAGITGEGAKANAKDTPPPPSPETPKTPQVQGRVQTGASACRDPKWLFNSQTQMCYPNPKSCEAADKKGICQ
ncbi:MAG: hypothetical protein AAB802_04420 [Patescibacteria group bacterium]